MIFILALENCHGILLISYILPDEIKMSNFIQSSTPK